MKCFMILCAAVVSVVLSGCTSSGGFDPSDPQARFNAYMDAAVVNAQANLPFSTEQDAVIANCIENKILYDTAYNGSNEYPNAESEKVRAIERK